MEKIKKIESRENEFVEQLQKLLSFLFIPSLSIGFDLDYYIGEDDKGTRGLCFEINSKDTGVIYWKFQSLEPHETPYDYEEEFINEITKELVVTGISFINLEKIQYDAYKKLEGTWLKASRKIYMN